MAIETHRVNTVLNVKTYQQKKTHQELRSVQEKKAIESEALADLEGKKESAYASVSTSVKAQAREMQTGRAFLSRLAREIQHQQKKVETIEMEEFEKREILKEQTQAMKVIERLREKLLAEERKEIERKEQRLIDVLAQRVKLRF